MESGQKFYRPTVYVDGLSKVTAKVHEHRATGVGGGMVTFEWYGGRPDAYPEREIYASKQDAEDECLRRLRTIRAEIDAAIALVEARKVLT